MASAQTTPPGLGCVLWKITTETRSPLTFPLFLRHTNLICSLGQIKKGFVYIFRRRASTSSEAGEKAQGSASSSSSTQQPNECENPYKHSTWTGFPCGWRIFRFTVMRFLFTLAIRCAVFKVDRERGVDGFETRRPSQGGLLLVSHKTTHNGNP